MQQRSPGGRDRGAAICLCGRRNQSGGRCIINAGAIVDHNAVLEDGVHAAPRATIKAGATVERCMKVDSGEIIRSPWEK